MNNQNENNQSIIIEDLETENADDNKGGPSRFAGRRGGSSTVADDVVVDGRIITAENYD